MKNKNKNKNKILLFIPAYNCEKQIVRVLDQIDGDVKEFIGGIIVVNNRSTDKTEESLIDYKKKHKELDMHILRNDSNYNLGGSHKVAFDYAMKNKYDYVIVLHGDDQGNISDLVPYLKSKEFEKYDSLLGARFMKGSKLEGYSKFRTFGNIVYNILFSIVVKRKIYDLGSGLNMYKVESLKSKYYYRFPDKLTFNYCMVMAIHYYKQNIMFFPITWKENDQASNVKLMSQAFDVLKMLGKYAIHKDYIRTELRNKPIKKYSYKEIIDEEE